MHVSSHYSLLNKGVAASIIVVVAYLSAAVVLSGSSNGSADHSLQSGLLSSLKAAARAHVGTARGPYIAALICVLAAVVAPFSVAFGKQLARRMLGMSDTKVASKAADAAIAKSVSDSLSLAAARLTTEADLAELEKSEAFQAAKASRTLPADERCDIFLSHAWGPMEEGTAHRPLQRRAHLIAAALRQAGYTVWLDVERMSGSTITSMCLGISMASAVVICFSNAYADSDSCKTEAFHALDAKKPLFFVNVGETPDFDPKGAVANADRAALETRSWLSSKLLRDHLWADARTIAAAANAGGIPKLLQMLAADARVHRTTKPLIATSATAASASAASLAALSPELLRAASQAEGEASDPAASPTASLSPSKTLSSSLSSDSSSATAPGVAEKAASKARSWFSSIRKAASAATESATAAVSGSIASLSAQQPQSLMAVPAAPLPVPAGLAASLSALGPQVAAAAASAAAAAAAASATASPADKTPPVSRGSSRAAR